MYEAEIRHSIQSMQWYKDQKGLFLNENKGPKFCIVKDDDQKEKRKNYKVGLREEVLLCKNV